MADVPAPTEVNRGPRVETKSGGIGYFIPPELKEGVREKGRQLLNLASALDPVQGIMRGMRASGQAFDSELSVEERKRAAIEAGLETAAPLMMMGMGALAKQPIKATVLDVLTPTGAPKEVVDDIADPSRRKFIKSAVATGGIAAIAPDVITEALEKVPAAVSRVKPVPNPIDIFSQNMKILRREMEEAYDAADEMDVYAGPVSGSIRDAYDEAVEQAEKLAYDLDATTEMDLRELVSEMGSKEIAGATDESIEELSQALTDFRMVSEDEYIEQMIPLAEEIKRRGLLGVKENGITQYPYARSVVDDVDYYLRMKSRSENIPTPSGLDISKMKMTDRETIPVDDLVRSDQEDRAREMIRRALVKEFELGQEKGLSSEQIDTNVAIKRRTLEKKYGIDFSKADGGEMRKGVESLNETARRMNEKTAINLPSKEELAAINKATTLVQNNVSIKDVPVKREGILTVQSPESRELMREFGNLEYEADMQPLLDPIARLGFDPDEVQIDFKTAFNKQPTSYKHFVDRFTGRSVEGSEPSITITGDDVADKNVQAHEFRERGLQMLAQDYVNNAPKYFEKYGPKKHARLARLVKQIKDDDGGDYSRNVREMIAEFYEKPERYFQSAKYVGGYNPERPESSEFEFVNLDMKTPMNQRVLGFHSSEFGDKLTSEELQELLDKTGVRVRKVTNEQTPEMSRARLETRNQKEFRNYLNTPKAEREPNEFFDAVLDLTEHAADLNAERRGFAQGGEMRKGVGSLSETARRMNEGGEVSIDAEVNAIIPAVIMTESTNNPKAVSEDGAIGLMQVLPRTAMKPGFGVPTIFEIAREEGFYVPEETEAVARELLFMPDLNVEFGSRYLKAMRNKYDNMEDALRAYNAGPTNFNNYLTKGRDLNVLTDEAIQYPLKVAAANQGVNPNEPLEYQAFTDSPQAFPAFMEVASQERPVSYIRPRARPPVEFTGPRPKPRPKFLETQLAQKEQAPTNLRQKYSPEGIEQMLTGTIGEPLLPVPFQQGSPYSSRP